MVSQIFAGSWSLNGHMLLRQAAGGRERYVFFSFPHVGIDTDGRCAWLVAGLAAWPVADEPGAPVILTCPGWSFRQGEQAPDACLLPPKRSWQ